MLKPILAGLLTFIILSGFNFPEKHDCDKHREHNEVLVDKVDYKILGPRDLGYQPPVTQMAHLQIDARLRNYAGDNRVKIMQALELMQTVINSQEFQEQVYNFTFKGERQFNQNEGYSNEQIYSQLMDAREILLPESQGIINLDLSLYTPKWWQITQRYVVGYTHPDSLRIFMNTNFFKKFEPSDVAGNMTHEWVHKMGYSHDFNANEDRPYSVPYAVGYIMRTLAAKVAKGEKLTSVAR
jgi:hypothetical protein